MKNCLLPNFQTVDRFQTTIHSHTQTLSSKPTISNISLGCNRSCKTLCNKTSSRADINLPSQTM